MASNITWSPDFSGTPNDFDRRAADLLLDVENRERASRTPPDPPLTYNKANILLILQARMNDWWSSWIDQAESKIAQEQFRARIPISTDAQIAAALAELEPLP